MVFRQRQELATAGTRRRKIWIRNRRRLLRIVNGIAAKELICFREIVVGANLTEILAGWLGEVEAISADAAQAIRIICKHSVRRWKKIQVRQHGWIDLGHQPSAGA